MIKRLIKRVFGKAAPVRVAGAAHVIPYEEHGVSRDGISYGAKRVTDGLQAAGFQAFVVGGAVRDLLLDREPKDFDVATDATPEEVRNVFRRSRIIGRRFRLVHVMFGEETVEVSTFRRAIDAEDACALRQEARGVSAIAQRGIHHACGTPGSLEDRSEKHGNMVGGVWHGGELAQGPGPIKRQTPSMLERGQRG